MKLRHTILSLTCFASPLAAQGLTRGENLIALDGTGQLFNAFNIRAVSAVSAQSNPAA